ncbi:MAG: sigma-70 family RNA polymerase sigma factor [Flavobacteriaceae bacterium]|nr:sigma-70 family RNA polymerase sigma factor [Flavobacteriaceae bacterium]
MTLDELILGCKKQNPAAQGELYRRFSPVLLGVCLRYSPNRAEAEDNLQDSFLTIFEKVEQFKDKGSFEGWMKRVTVNTVLQKYRKQRVFRLTDEERIEEEVDDTIEFTQIPLDFLLQCIQELPTKYRMVFSMYVLDGYSHKEIGGLLEISDGTSKSNLARARAALKKKIEAYQQAQHNS